MLQRTSAALVVCLACLGGCAGPSAAAPRGGAPTRLTGPQLIEVSRVLAQSGDTVRAQQYLQHALREGMPEEQVVPGLLLLYVSDGQYRLAVDHAENYLRRHPRDRKVRLFLATLYGALGLDTRAVAEYARLIKDAPRDAQVHFALASTLHGAGLERARADAHFRFYLALEPNGPHAEEARALLLTEKP